jgi:hypothetical protein
MNEFEQQLSAHVDGLTPPVPPPYDDVVARRRRARARRRVTVATTGSAILVAGIVVGASALGTSSGPGPERPMASPTTSSDVPRSVLPWTDEKRPPPVTLYLGDRTVDLVPSSYCWGLACVDGFDTGPQADVGERDLLEFTYPGPDDGDGFKAFFREEGNDCARTFPSAALQTGPDSYAVRPAGPPGDYTVGLTGPLGTTYVNWQTTEAGPMPDPKARVGVVADDDSELTSYGVTLSVENIAAPSTHPEATITATAANGRSLEIGPLRSPGCVTTGTYYFSDKGRASGLEASGLGPAPFTYRVDLVLDGITYVGTATWPDDEVDRFHGYSKLTFDPPLPAYTG